MPQVDDLRLQNGVWEVYTPNNRWEAMNAPAQEYMNRNFGGVTGTGADQVFIPLGIAEPPVSKRQVESGITTAMGGGPVGELIADGYRTWTNNANAVWPPMKEDITSPILDKDGNLIGYNQIQDTEAIKQFLAYAKQNNLKFTDVELPEAGTLPLNIG